MRLACLHLLLVVQLGDLFSLSQAQTASSSSISSRTTEQHGVVITLSSTQAIPTSHLIANISSIDAILTSAVTDRMSEYHRITEIVPDYGHVSGRANVTISGEYLNCVGDSSLHFRLINDDLVMNLSCAHPPNSKNEVNCTIPLSGQIGEYQVQAICKRTNGELLWNTTDHVYFNVKPDPKIHEVHPLISIVSGGITQTVVGENLDSIVIARMSTVTQDGKRLTSICSKDTIDNSTVLKCRTSGALSSLNDSVRNNPNEINPNGYPTWIGFVFDEVTEYSNYSSIRLFLDPEIDKFKLDSQDYITNENKSIYITGVWPHMDFSSDDITVHIGLIDCNDIQLDPNQKQLTCYPPQLPKSVVRYGPGNILDVTATTGNYKQVVGKLRYISKESFHVIMIVMIAILAFIFVVSCAFGWLTLCAIKCGGIPLWSKKPPFRSISSYEPTVDTIDAEPGSYLEKRRDRYDDVGGSPIECVAMEYRGSKSSDPVSG